MKLPNPNSRPKAFSLVEFLVAAALGAAVITAAVIGFAVISGASTRGGRVDVQLPANTHSSLFGASGGYISVWPNPSYAEAARASLLRDKLLEDASSAAAVFCLGRSGLWTNSRPSGVSITNTNDFRSTATPTAFRQFLVSNDVAGATNFSTNQSGPLTTPGVTIFVVGGLATQSFQTNQLKFVAIYEVDFVATSNPAGTYASVRRYDPDSPVIPTDYYHAFYPGEDNAAGGFRPLACNFGRQGAGGTYDIAPNQPFTFLWWPDPLVSKLGGAAIPAAGSLPLRSAYANMSGRTSLFTVVPVFPGQ